ncbi:Lrp/AsnC family transcriptional regulator [Streptacidiphilus sp. PAMC 29251]
MTLLDTLDARIVLALDADPDATILALAQTLGVARNTVHARLRRMAAEHAIKNFSRRLDPAALGYGLVAFVSLAMSQSEPDGVHEGLLALPEVIEVHYITGDADLLARVVARDTADLHRITKAILAIDGVERTSTVISLAEAVPYRPRALLERLADR